MVQQTSVDKTFVELIRALAMVLDSDQNTKLYHAWRVAALSGLAAGNLLPDVRDQVFYGGLLHDIGALGFDDHIVHRVVEGRCYDPAVLSHSEKGYEIISELPGLQLAARMVLEHHERADGLGVPRKLRENQIHSGSFLIAISDFFDINLRRHPDKGADYQLALILEAAGSAFSAETVEAVMAILGDGGFYSSMLDTGSLQDIVEDLIRSMPVPARRVPNALDTTIRVFARIIDAKHAYTGGHSQRVARYSRALAAALGFEGEELEKVTRAAFLHDFGKIGVPRSILDKKGSLSGEEFAVIKAHPKRTMELLGSVEALKELAPWAGYHHEKYDGSGYPDGLKGEEIPLPARIIAVADAFDAITSNRPYQKTRDWITAVEIIKRYSGSQFSPEVAGVVDALLEETGKVDPAPFRLVV